LSFFFENHEKADKLRFSSFEKGRFFRKNLPFLETERMISSVEQFVFEGCFAVAENLRRA
jgi:hypothetical protein